MRLLRLGGDGELSLIEYVDDDIPPYAILSHTWGADHEEVTFDDLKYGSGKSKAGYDKIRFCEAQARTDNLQHFWIDTCCIDKANHTELSEAITSMFRWYREATKCYAYLSDVSVSLDIDSQAEQTWKQAFLRSRWYTRGFTLQELLAPKVVEFFSREGVKLGDKNTLEREIHQTTGIPISALRVALFSDFSVEERLRWSEKRTTKKKEDRAYCLLGIFDVSMSLRYGEGDKAFERLKKKIGWPPTSSSTEQLFPTEQPGDVHAFGGARVHLGNSYGANHSEPRVDVRQNLLASLSFPQMSDRRAQISDASPDTYRWVLDGPTSVTPRWDCFRSWLSAKDDVKKIYWISGKPGSGKSTLSKFLDDTISDEHDLVNWADGKPVIRLNHFFWNSGNQLQNSTEGLLRHLILQILEQRPQFIAHGILSRLDFNHRSSAISWTVTGLADAVRHLLSTQQAEIKFFLLIDGLDECQDSDIPNAELIKYLLDFAAFTNVKLCVSSRPLNIFQDAFAGSPQLRLEHLTYTDMQTYVSSKLKASPSWKLLSNVDPRQASSFIRKLVIKAEGVFLWAALVVRNTLEGLRDGDDPWNLARRLDDIPTDLEKYFLRILESIEEKYRCEASILFQVALWKEDKYLTLTPFRLIDTIFLSTPSETLDIEPRYRSFVSCLQGPPKFHFFFDSLMRKLNSRCKGLLECTDEGEILSLVDKIGIPSPSRSPSPDLVIGNQANGDSASATADDWLDRMFCMQIKPVHRSLRDFLLIPETRTLLYKYTGGQPIDPRSWLIEARLIRLMALTSLSYQGVYVAGLVSFLMCSISADGPSDRLTYSISLISSIVERFASDCQAQGYWYIYQTFQCFRQEQGTFLSLAIDFRLTPYVLAYMTTAEIRAKRGRPILDHILRPRYASERIGIFNQCPNIAILKAALRLGADPNEYVEDAGPTVWAAHLCFFADYVHASAYSDNSPELWLPWLQALQLLIDYGASPILPTQWLLGPIGLEGVASNLIPQISSARWPGLFQSNRIANHSCNERTTSMCTVSKLLRSLQRIFACDITSMAQDLERREASVLSSTAYRV